MFRTVEEIRQELFSELQVGERVTIDGGPEGVVTKITPLLILIKADNDTTLFFISKQKIHFN